MTALVFLAEGCEELEAVTVIDLLRRAEIDVRVVGLHEQAVTASRGVRLLPDASLERLGDSPEFSCLVLPGGLGGVQRLCEDPRVIALVQQCVADPSKVLGAICAAALVLDSAQVLSGKRFTCHPSVVSALRGGQHVDAAVVVDGPLVTSQGPGTAIPFALALIEVLRGPEAAALVAGPLCGGPWRAGSAGENGNECCKIPAFWSGGRLTKPVADQ